jgi:hypothetical protein
MCRKKARRGETRYGKSRENIKMKTITDELLLNRMGVYGHVLKMKM